MTTTRTLHGSWFTGTAALLAVACGGDANLVLTFTPGELRNELQGSGFESTDGNLVTDGVTDWANAPNLHVGIDLPKGSEDDAFGQGTKEDDTTPTPVLGSIPPNKSDLTRFYVANETVNGNEFLYLAWERDNVLGSANMDFELNQSSATQSNGVTAARAPGDILITYDLTNGGSTPVLGILWWVTTANGTPANCFAKNSLPCWGYRRSLTDQGYADGSVNTTTVVDPIPDPDVTLEGDISKGPRFGEAAINLTGAGVFTGGQCIRFGKARVTSRSSASFTAEVKDYIAPVDTDISNCAPATVTVIKQDAEGNPLPGAVLQLYLDDGNGTHDKADVLVGSDCTTGADGICTFTVDANGTYFAQESVPPAGYDVAPPSKVDVTLSTAPQSNTVIITDYPAPGTIHIQKRDTQGNALAGAVFTLYSDKPLNGGAPDEGDTAGTGHPTCTTDKLGQCSFLDVPLGEYWVVETEAPQGYLAESQPYRHVVMGMGTEPGQGQTVYLVFVNEFVSGSILVNKRDMQDMPLAGAVFTLYPDNPTTGGVPDAGDTAGTGHPTCTTDKLGQCMFLDVPAGEYWVVETVPPQGYLLGEVPYQHVTIGMGVVEGGGAVELVFVNAPVTGSIHVQKRDTQGNALAGAVFTLYPDNPTTGGAPDAADTAGTGQPTCTTDKLGQCMFPGVPVGEYWVVETEAPPGYLLAAVPYQHVTVSSDGAGSTLGFVNELMAGVIQIQKYDTDGATLGGAVFTLYPDNPQTGGAPDAGDTAGTGHPTCTTDKLGQCTFPDVPLGEYWVVETEAPQGYFTGETPYQHVSLTPTGLVVELSFINRYAVGGIYIVKRDRSGRLCGGAEYTLYVDSPPTGGAPDADTVGTGLYTCATDKLGQCSFLGVRLAEYWVVETRVPDGCSAAEPTAQHVTLGTGDTPGGGDTVDLLF
ncbi:MAG: SpaA isopeptide-forming pilin-related protein [Myxococcota bacterium]